MILQKNFFFFVCNNRIHILILKTPTIIVHTTVSLLTNCHQKQKTFESKIKICYLFFTLLKILINFNIKLTINYYHKCIQLNKTTNKFVCSKMCKYNSCKTNKNVLINNFMLLEAVFCYRFFYCLNLLKIVKSVKYRAYSGVNR